MRRLSDEEIRNYTKDGKGKTGCKYWVSMCVAGTITGFDCGTCDWIYNYCGYSGGDPGSSCGTCTCH